MIPLMKSSPQPQLHVQNAQYRHDETVVTRDAILYHYRFFFFASPRLRSGTVSDETAGQIGAGFNSLVTLYASSTMEGWKEACGR
jgi:hypothetical protein